MAFLAAVVPDAEAGLSDAKAGQRDATGAALGDAEGRDSDAATGDGSAPCDPAALGWSPAGLSGLVLWLTAADLLQTPTGGPVASWLDRSAAHNNAAQSVPSYQPTFQPTSIGSHPTLHFDGAQDFLVVADSPSLQWGTGDYAILVVARFTTSLGTVNQMLFEKSMPQAPWNGAQLYVNSAKPTVAPTVSSQVSEYSYATASGGPLDGAPHLFGGRRLGTTLEVRVDGAAAGTATVSPIVDISDPGQPVMIGQNGYDPMPGFEALEGDIAEMVVISGDVQASDLRALECHLMLEYGL